MNILLFSLFDLLPKLYGLLVVIPLVILYNSYLRKKAAKRYPKDSTLTTLEIKDEKKNRVKIINDKIIVIEEIELPNLIKVIHQFCDMHTEEVTRFGRSYRIHR